MRTEINQKALAGASKNAEKAFLAVTDQKLTHIPINEKTAWAMAAIIHCDFCRLLIAFEECEREGIARLLSMADITSKLFEARNWYNNTGSKLLREIASNKPCGISAVNKKIDELKNAHQINMINKYKCYRDKFSYHYDKQAIFYLQDFCGENADEFNKILVSFVRFSGEWVDFTKSLIQDHAL